MLLSRLAASAAGPSRQVCARAALPLPLPRTRSLCSACFGLARQPIVTRAGLALSVSTRGYASKTPGNVKTVKRRTRISSSEWPWVVVENPAKQGVDEIERVIFARHNSNLGKMFWGTLILFFAGAITYAAIPSPQEAAAKGILPSDEDKDRTVMGIPIATFFTYVTAGCITVFGGIGLGAALILSRQISRLTLVQQKAKDAPASSARMFLRINTAVQESLPSLLKPREMPVSAFSVLLTRGRRNRQGQEETNEYLTCNVKDPQAKPWSRFLDKMFDYKLDFSRNHGKRTEEELVLSIARLDDTFGELKYRDGRNQM